MNIKQLYIFFINAALLLNLSAQQKSISKIEEMPDIPNPYELLDFKKITAGYDSLIFDLNNHSEYLPAIFINNSTVNYPEHPSFGIHSYIGTNYPSNGEAINVLPAVIGASLIGIDKSNDRGYNWVLMCQEYFNNRQEENVYLNSPQSSSGNDWWYDTMPNVFFYQLNHLYPETENFSNQFVTIADRWLEALKNMGGSTAPWGKAFLNYRAWYLSTMTGNSSGVVEPEAAGAIGWILYNAYIETGNDEYRIGAEWAMEYLNELNENPSYELQLSYGAYIAARMNAELNTDYDISKILNWCFNMGPLRGWGAVTGKWGNYEVNGLIGEISGSNDYAFAMNTFEQIGALVPLVRYDERFADAIGKWVLNATNASRLFYSNYLPDLNQDNWRWTNDYDPNSYIAYEGLREEKNGRTPYATGDAISGGWASTNLGLYGSSHVGILGGIVDTTNISQILKLDLLKTDYYHSPTYPTYMYFNPYPETKDVIVNLPIGEYSIYEMVNNVMLTESVSGTYTLSINAKSSSIIVIIPSGGVVEYELNKTKINNRIVDFNSGRLIDNYPPRIKAIGLKSNEPIINSLIDVYTAAVDYDGNELSYIWEFNGQKIENDSNTIMLQMPAEQGKYQLTSIVSDEQGLSDTAAIDLDVVQSIIEPPKILQIKANPRKIDLSEKTLIKCFVDHNGNNALTYEWYSSKGIIDGSDSVISWTAPPQEGNYYISCTVSNSEGIFTKDSIQLLVRDFSRHVIGNLITYYPFDSTPNDASGNNHHGELKGAQFTLNRFAESDKALQFDGINDHVVVNNQPSLNFENGICVNFWMYINEFFDREAYPISHGNWENRWKASITNKKLRWTINSSSGIVDLDSESELKLNEWYFVNIQFNGEDIELYLNNELDAFKAWSGIINSTELDLIIGQATPTNSEYNFKGKIDDVRIFDYALSRAQIDQYYGYTTSINNTNNNLPPESTKLYQNYPNPFNNQTNISYYIIKNSRVKLVVYNSVGEKIKRLINQDQLKGFHQFSWDGKDSRGKQLSTGIYFVKLQAGNYRIVKKIMLLK